MARDFQRVAQEFGIVLISSTATVFSSQDFIAERAVCVNAVETAVAEHHHDIGSFTEGFEAF